MAKQRSVGRPRKKPNRFGRWLEKNGIDRWDAAEKLGVSRPYVDLLARSERRPGMELAIKIEKYTKGAVTPEFWLKETEPHSRQ